MDIHTWSDKAFNFKGTVVYRTSINRGLLEITLTITVVLKGRNTSPSQRDNSDNFIQKTGEMNEQKINIIYNKDSNSQALCWNLKLESSKNKNQNKKSFFIGQLPSYILIQYKDFLFQLWFLTSFNTAETDHFSFKLCLCLHVNLSLLNKKWLEIKS